MRRAVMSIEPPGGNGATSRTGRVGYACASAIRVIAGHTATPATRCKKSRRRSFMAFPASRPLETEKLAYSVEGRAGRNHSVSNPTQPDVALRPQPVEADMSSIRADSRFDPEPT